MAKLTTEVVNKVKASIKCRNELALVLGLSDQAIMFNLRKNADNGVLTKIEALRCMRDCLKFQNVDQLLDRSSEG